MLDLHAYQPTLEQIIRSQRAALGLREAVETVAATPLGAGESNISLRITVNGPHDFTLRIAYRADTEDNLAREFALLQRLPPGFGPTPLYLDISKQRLPYAFALLSFIPGEIVTSWTAHHLQLHANKLARLHLSQVPYWNQSRGPLRYEPFDIYQEFQTSLGYWRNHYPAVVEVEVVAQLIPRLAAYFQQHNDLFTSLSSFSLIHADPCLPNILFTSDDVWYIDWEWTRYGDPAYDIAQLVWDIDNPPWQCTLSEEQLGLLLHTYQQQRPDPTLRERRDVWMAYIQFFDHLYYRSRVEHLMTNSSHSLSQDEYRAVVARITNALSAKFL
jgi:Ser/Thr protein kinase RdoA (MazF antagonist)